MAQPTYEDELPLRWQPLPAAGLSAPETQRLQAENIRLLQLFTLLGERVENPAPDELTRENQRLQALDLKLNLALDLLVDLLCEHGEAIPARPVRLTTDAIEWQEPTEPPPAGSGVIVALYLKAGFPKPLRFPGMVSQDLPQAGWAGVSFAGLDEGFRDALTRFIFRHHRRAIHESRQG